MIEVLAISFWHFGADNSGCVSGLTGQVTHCRYCGVDFHVRENINGIPSFYISSGERWGDKKESKPRSTRQVLELMAPEEIWNQIAEVVRAEDPLQRAVLRNRNFNQKFLAKIKMENENQRPH